MPARLSASFRIIVLFLVVTIFSAAASAGTTFQIVYTFVGGNNASQPSTPLTVDGAGRLYGDSYFGGGTTACNENGCGTVFQLVPKNGHWAEQVLTNFPGSTYGPYASAPLVLDNAGNIYGIGTDEYTNTDGEFVTGQLFELLNSDGSYTETTLHYFILGDTDAEYPQPGLVRDREGNLYGSSDEGGSSNEGTVFEFSPTGDGTWTETLIFQFGTEKSDYPIGPMAIDKEGNLYGITANGGDYGFGAVYRLSKENGAWEFRELYDFPPPNVLNPPTPGGLVVDDEGNLYVNTQYEGTGVGSLFKLTPAQGYWTYSLIHSFTGATDGGYPSGALAVDASGNIYGTTFLGGMYGNGTVFEFTPGASGTWSETVLYNFRGTADGLYPDGVIRDSAGNLYGTTEIGGAGLDGIVFEITP
jgi:uncharacterized repeat protein (TIGR03803 family)